MFCVKVRVESVWDSKQVIISFSNIHSCLNTPYLLHCKIQCTFYCHRVVKIIAPLFVYIGPPPLGSTLPQRTKLSDGVGCKFRFCDFHRENVVFVLKKYVKWRFLGAVNSSGLSSHKSYSLNWKGIDQK